MSQLVFKFPFKVKYSEKDYYVSSNNFSVYKLIESWPNWPDKWLNVFGPKGSGKTHLSKILEKKFKSVKIFEAKEINDLVVSEIGKLDCLIIENYEFNIKEKLFYTILNHSKQVNNFIVVNSYKPIKTNNFTLKDLKSRAESFLSLGIDLPTDELLRVIITKSFSEKQIVITPKVSEYIINNIERSYEKVFKIIKEIDDLSLSSGKSININLIKKVIANE